VSSNFARRHNHLLPNEVQLAVDNTQSQFATIRFRSREQKPTIGYHDGVSTAVFGLNPLYQALYPLSGQRSELWAIIPVCRCQPGTNIDKVPPDNLDLLWYSLVWSPGSRRRWPTYVRNKSHPGMQVTFVI
jgi:hypothetical protein